MAPGGKAFIIFNFPPGVSFVDEVGDLPRVKKPLGGKVEGSLPLHCRPRIAFDDVAAATEFDLSAMIGHAVVSR
jgi:hypothetical protein